MLCKFCLNKKKKAFKKDNYHNFTTLQPSKIAKFQNFFSNISFQKQAFLPQLVSPNILKKTSGSEIWR